MSREAVVAVFGLSLAACSQRTMPIRDVREADSTASITPCRRLNDACPEGQVNCDGDADSACLADKQIYFGGYCMSVQTNDHCSADGSLTQDFRDYCDVLACLGGDKDKCLEDGATQCKPAFCNALDELQDP
ncbi:MAG: hypothetical protein H7Z43_15825, partial [Clostridia bacterium]|nr:hypothetical protein [Deltaproteobacteria bacterium]